MAPVAPAPRMSHRAKALARLADPTLPRKVHRADNVVTDAFLTSKRDKQLIRKSAFRSQVVEREAARLTSRSGVRKSTAAAGALKRRRPSKKLVATLASLADALPDLDAAEPSTTTTDGKKRSAKASLRSRPGALKRKAKLVRAETARFEQNLAQLTATQEEAKPAQTMHVEENSPATAATPAAATPAALSTANRWALLRNFISTTMEQNPAFSQS